MKRFFFSLILLVLMWQTARSQQADLGRILDTYYKASHLEELSRIQTVVTSGTIVQQDLMPVKVTRTRPGLYLMEYDVADITALLAWDGTTAWFTAPWTGNAAAQKAPPDRAADLKVRADIDGILYDWKRKGHHLSLDGKDTVDGRLAWRIRVTRADSGQETYLVDCENAMLVKRLTTRMIGGKEVPMELVFRDYRPVRGIPFPFSTETSYAGRVNEVRLDTVMLDVPVDRKIFAWPGK